MLVRQSRIPRKDFLESFPSNATKKLNGLIRSLKIKNIQIQKQLEDVKADVVIAQKSMKAIEDRLGMSIKDIKEINRAMSMGETKMRRTKKDMVEANLRLVISIAKNIPTEAYNFGSDSGRQHWSK